MPAKVLLDTDTLSEILKGRDPRVGRREADYLLIFGFLTISAVSVMEVVRGLEQAGRVRMLVDFRSLLSRT